MKEYYPGMEFETPKNYSEQSRKQESPQRAPKSNRAGEKMSVTKVGNFQSFKEAVESTDEVLLKFEADWCMPCKAMSSVVEEVANLHPEIKFLAVDVEGEGMEEVLVKYKIRSIPAFVHVRRGTQIKSACGTVSRAELTSLIKDV